MLQSKIDNTLSGFIDQLFSQRRRSALPGPRGGTVISDPKTADEILRAPKQFLKNFQLLQHLGHSRFSTNGPEWERRRELTQRYYGRAAATPNQERVAEIYRRRLDNCETTSPSVIAHALFAASVEIFYDTFRCTVAI